jgi:hypothetical protein
MVFAPDSTGGLILERTIKNGIDGPVSIAFDSSYDLFVANAGNNKITEYDETSSTPNVVTNTISNGIHSPTQVGLDGNDNLWVADSGDNTLRQYAPGGKDAIQTISSGINGPVAMAFGAGGGLVSVANAGNNTVTSYAVAAGSKGRTITDGIAGPSALSYDGSGNLFVANALTSEITEYPPASTTLAQTIKSGVRDPVSLTIFAGTLQGPTLWVANHGNGTLTGYVAASGLAGATTDPPPPPGSLAGIASVITGPEVCACIIAAGSASVQVLNLGAIQNPSLTLTPDSIYEGNTNPSAVAIGP